MSVNSYPFPQGRQVLSAIKPYVPGKPLEEAEREIGLKNMVKLASNENPLGPSPLALKALQDRAGNVHQYPDSSCSSLRLALAGHLGLNPDNLLLGNGSDEILKMIALAYLTPEHQAVMAAPTFSEYEFVVLVAGAVARKVALKDFTHDLEAMLAEINPLTKLVFICNPNNPTGTIVTKAALDRFLAVVPPEVLVVLDEAYREYVTDPGYPDGMEYIRQGQPNLIVLRTFSKIYGLAGLRVGYAAAAREVAAWINRVREPFNVNSLAQAAAIAALGDFRHLDQSCQVNEAGKNYLYNKLEELGLAYIPTQANFVLINVKENSRRVYDRLLQRGVIVRAGEPFGLDQWIRVTVGTAEQVQRFFHALREIMVL
ncbi:MAG: histidinol-phosphate transaminase [Bacillota bacterium]